MHFITLAIVTALVGAVPIPPNSAGRNFMTLAVSGNNRQIRGGLRAAQASEEVPIGKEYDSKDLKKNKREATAQSCYKGCEGDEVNSKYKKSYNVVDMHRSNTYTTNEGAGGDSYKNDGSDSGSDSDNDEPSGLEGDKPYTDVGGEENFRTKAYSSITDTDDDSSSDSDNDSDSEDVKPSGSKGGRGKEGKTYKGVGGKGNSRTKAYKPSVIAGGDSRGEDTDSSSDSDNDDNNDSDGEDNKHSGSKGSLENINKAYDGVGGKRNFRTKVYKSNTGAGDDSRNSDGNSSSDLDNDSDSDDVKPSASKGGRIYTKAYNGVGGEGSSKDKYNVGADGDSCDSGTDSDSDSDSDSDNDLDDSDNARNMAYNSYSN